MKNKPKCGMKVAQLTFEPVPNLWNGMPEFEQEKKEPYAKIIFRFESEEDLQGFAKLIGQKLTKKTKSSWHPFKPHRRPVKEVWIKQ